jgi:Eco57I restriction-modification methylase/TaqI-like C-terminal specificity domain
MNTETLKNTFNAPYQSTIWKSFLKELFKDLSSSYFETPVDLKDNSLVKHKDVEHIWEFGDITLADGRIIKFYEVVLKEDQQVTKNRVGLRNIVSGEIGFGYIDGAIITYHNHKASDWRFTFISKSLYWDEDNSEVKTETHPKRYTYLLGQTETVKTAVNQFEWLFKQIQTREIRLEDILIAFSVEKLSKEFYDGYFHQYETFVGYIVDNPKAFSHFLNQIKSSSSADDKHKKAEHLVSDFVKMFLGRIVFLYFLQKKGWMGVPLNKDWGEGQRDFLFRLFEEFADKNNFYQKALVPLFFHTLNEDRSHNNDVFSVTNTRIPYLNGGLFDKDATEPEDIQFETQRFIDLFAFFSHYNFTVDESSPDDQDIGVDPEMLGHIFENLLEDNKDKGAFYTPKEIVHYMTQESLIEYLHTHLPETGKEQLDTFVKRKQKAGLNDKELRTIDGLLEDVKICDPAIGSGAFPMGLLQEIFALKGLIAFERGYTTWSPAKVKESIIENSIYGVDIEEGAVDIARLRFWLSLVVDEPTPRPLPNLDYKIVCGNSLVNRYALDAPINEVFSEFNKGRENGDKVDLEKYKSLVKEYLHEADHDKKAKFKQLIEDVKSAFKTYYSNKELKKLRDKQGDLLLLTGNNLFGNNKNAAEKRKIASLKKDIAKLEAEKKEREEAKLYKNAIEWRFEFPNLLDNEGKFEGFDIVIGNPPYLRIQGIRKTNPEFADFITNNFEAATGSFDLYAVFAERSLSLTKTNGVLNFIMPVKWSNAAFGKGLRKIISKQDAAYKIISFAAHQVFNASTYTALQWFKRGSTTLSYIELDRPLKSKTALGNFLFGLSDNDFAKIEPDKTSIEPWTLVDSDTKRILEKIELHPKTVNDLFEKIFQGIATSKDSVYFLFNCIDNGKTITGYSKELERKVEIEKGLVKPLLKGDDVHRYCDIQTNKYVLFPYKFGNKGAKEFAELYTKNELISLFPIGFSYLKECEEILKARENGRLKDDKFWYRYIYPKNQLLFKKEKLIAPDISMGGNFSLDANGVFYSTTTLYGYVKRKNIKESYKFLLAILNSKVLWWYLVNTGTVLANGYFRFKPDYIKPFPIPELSNIENEKAFVNLVDFVLYLKSNEKPLNEYVPNTHISETFEEVLDALVFELYFPKEFKEAGISFINYAERDFQSIEGKTEMEQTEIIHTAYQKLREKDNEIRNNLKEMKIELRDLLMPILTA